MWKRCGNGESLARNQRVGTSDPPSAQNRGLVFHPVKKEGYCNVADRKLYDYGKLLGDGDISIKLFENHWVQIRSGQYNTKMVGLAQANFPALPLFPAESTNNLPAQVLRNLIAKTI